MFLVEDKEMQPLGVTFLGCILSSQEAGSRFIRNRTHFGQEAVLIILGCVLSGKNTLIESPRITSLASLSEKNDLCQSFPVPDQDNDPCV